MNELELRRAVAQDIAGMTELIFAHGVTPWNHLPRAEVTAHLQAIAEDSVQAVLAERDGKLLGFVSFELSRQFARYQPPQRREQVHAYICEAVIHRDMAGQGLGSRLLGEAVNCLVEQGVQDIYIDRHEENAASAGMMRKAGFVELDTFADPTRRPNGSGRTTLCCLRIHP
ncbi:L-amino acid N-acyltransferase YncA [Pseudomonas sp. SJZ079]|uniref:GNAT family N-acetyltransferase n=1 Tax=Pseudomonas sp. SJZ079 TaxID=2572887 RepID=UPI001199A0B7|nr:GNAT family N-acetyltransferase [Pseudomonas sp. SJZ079]TWC28300.1 L-amino acid N-acyltransferase YncA [Pseudomonas sp. SJZ079]